MLGILKNVSVWLNKPFRDVSQADMEDFITDFHNGLIRQANGKDYSMTTKTTIKKVIRKFWKWLKGESLRYPDEVEWIDTTEIDPDVPIVTFDEMKTVISAAKQTRTRALLAVLFELGCRIGELLNIRVQDVQKDNKNGWYTITIRNCTSKTKGRTVPVLAFQDELTLHLQNLKPGQEYVFDVGYQAALKLVYRASYEALGYRINNNVIRHSSATYFANIVPTAAQLNYRYGWSLSSKMAQRYIERAGINLAEATERTVKNVVNKERGEMESIVARNRYLELEIRSHREKMERIESQIDLLVKYLKRTNQLHEVLNVTQ
jgi:integrase